MASPRSDSSSPLVLIPQHFGSLLFDRDSVRYLRFERAATDCLEQLMVHSAGELWSQTPSGDREELERFLDHLEALGVLDVNGRLPAARRSLVPPEHCLAGPLAVHLEVMGACDLSCRHCFAGPLPRHHNPLELWELETLFDDLASIGSYRLGITGGEPMLRHDIFEILDAALEHGLAPCVTTNGMQLDAALAQQFARRPQVRLHVSLDGATARTNDLVRGVGVFQEVTSRLRRLQGSLRYTLAFTLTRHSVHETTECVALARELGASDVVFRPLYPAGHAAVDHALMPNYQDYVRGLRRVASEPATGEVAARNPNQCGAARTSASISVQGRVNACSFLGPEFDGESIRDRPFSEIWRNGAALQSVRGSCEAACGNSESGGCRVRALQLHGDAHATDPWHDMYLADTGDRAHHPLVQLEVRAERAATKNKATT